ncbi:hypothetical protein MJA45_03870 [Paenibacillus aurantius]|uniref:Uncharacterized protein n=1 Tax=Paenibacillus aurantius TaxID=2918900 RepID=A0AA96LFG0_9BACL|nr:hypothetical protein [Paenibacillus aurantius]WNQ12199.1 hypothetical protein MJA45_03870 [Paenibacillus aurantius]
MGEKIATGWLKMTYEIGFDEFEKFFSDMEVAISVRKKRVEDDFEEQSKGLDDESKDEMFEYMYLDDYTTINKSFPNILKRSMVISCYSFFEVQLKNLCDVLHRRYRFSSLGRKKNFGIIQSKDYLIKTTDTFASLFESRLWEQVNEIRQIRNFIAHEGKSIVESGTELYRIILSLDNMINLVHFTTRESGKVSRIQL